MAEGDLQQPNDGNVSNNIVESFTAEEENLYQTQYSKG